MLYLALVAIASAPVWLVPNFVHQDAPSHTYNAYLLANVLSGEPEFAKYFRLNPVPNSTGHLLLAAALEVLSPMIAAKLVGTLCFAALAASVGWLAYAIGGTESSGLGVAMGTALAFNTPWLLGFFSFIIGIAGACFTLGLVWRWRSRMTVPRTVVLSILVLAVYFSHLVGFGALLVSLFVVCVDHIVRRGGWQTPAAIAVAFLPVVPAIVWYLMYASSNAGVDPTWGVLVLSPLGLLEYARTADPFAILTRRKFIPFTSVSSLFSFALAPILWTLAAVLILLFSLAIRMDARKVFTDRAPFLVIAFFFVAVGLFGPDHFGGEHGSMLRMRLSLFGIAVLAAAVACRPRRSAAFAATACLAVVLTFQTAALAEYAITSNDDVARYLEATKALPDLGGIAVFGAEEERTTRFTSDPLVHLTGFAAIDKGAIDWSNYEPGYYIFPIAARDPEIRRLSLALNGFKPAPGAVLDPESDAETAMIKETLSRHHDKIESILVFGKGRPDVTALIKDWYEETPYFTDGEVEIYRRRPGSGF